MREREYKVQAAIVKLMKKVNNLQMEPLTNLTVSAIEAFTVSPVMVSEQVDRLIENDILKRHADDKTVIVYNAAGIDIPRGSR